ncbi:secretin N-terminal domain-containing protein [Pseudoalteromonas sp. NJ631]|uniref:secretin N-terminal domain-containing protein n=1 Tax=Pseudoalteromonas sp. NJ631 TaxID=493915 RepID=UPI0002F9EE76|nr:secretin N-terminal domain-containing protein [Pseudoalteromonas sp. NJ631]
MKQINKSFCFSMITVLTLSACKSTNPKDVGVYNVDKSYIEQNIRNTEVEGAELLGETSVNNKEKIADGSLQFLPKYRTYINESKVTDDVIDRFSNTEMLSVSAESLRIIHFLHYVLGDQLKLNYVLSDELKDDNQTITLNIQDQVSERKLFLLSRELLEEKGYVLRFRDNIFYVHQKEDSNSTLKDVVFGYGKSVDDVPQTSNEIIQMVPFTYGMQMGMANTLRQMLGIKASSDVERNAINVYGKRNEIIRALELINMFDRPSLANREIGVYQSVYMPTKKMLDSLTELLKQEGITLQTGSSTAGTVTVVNIEQQNRLIMFANERSLLDRVVFWAEELDKPINTAEKQYFIYQPKYSRAVDMGESLEALIGNGGSFSNSTSVANEASSSASRPSVTSASNKDLKMVIDERSNSVIFYTTGESYQQILPLVKRLDILPKQVMLEMVIAEVSMTDEFKQGVEFLLKGSNNYSLSTEGAFMGEGGFGGLSYALTGDRGKVAVNLFEKNSLVNILSRPSIVVRDGVQASINVGKDIPIIGQTTSDPINGERQTTSIEYRKTGLQLDVKPTVNAQGVVLMEISQKVSNELQQTTSTSGNPSLFDRTIKTEVVAESGQTIVLGGIISENRSLNDSGVPILKDLPILGELFSADTKDGDKTELVILVTPRVIQSNDEWKDIKEAFRTKFEQLSF